jgi:hypothetical protein
LILKVDAHDDAPSAALNVFTMKTLPRASPVMHDAPICSPVAWNRTLDLPKTAG